MAWIKIFFHGTAIKRQLYASVCASPPSLSLPPSLRAKVPRTGAPQLGWLGMSAGTICSVRGPQSILTNHAIMPVLPPLCRIAYLLPRGRRPLGCPPLARPEGGACLIARVQWRGRLQGRKQGGGAVARPRGGQREKAGRVLVVASCSCCPVRAWWWWWCAWCVSVCG